MVKRYIYKSFSNRHPRKVRFPFRYTQCFLIFLTDPSTEAENAVFTFVAVIDGENSHLQPDAAWQSSFQSPFEHAKMKFTFIRPIGTVFAADWDTYITNLQAFVANYQSFMKKPIPDNLISGKHIIACHAIFKVHFRFHIPTFTH